MRLVDTVGALAGVALTAVLAACGGANTPPLPSAAPVSVASSPVEACTVFKAEDASGVLKQGVGEPQAGLSGPFSSCVYVAKDQQNQVTVRLNQSSFTAASFEALVSRHLAESKDAQAHVIDGLGDEAYLITPANDVMVLHRSTMFHVAVRGGDAADAAQLAAQVIIGRLS
ncbi:hypothetical protein [Actinokineospora sp. HUAS TT18]|uniref:hypothetical protein n=1 Tax=Actinokineospora sp. HUAS TT18 TaxID=3447451 RepID=UPI003F51D61B